MIDFDKLKNCYDSTVIASKDNILWLANSLEDNGVKIEIANDIRLDDSYTDILVLTKISHNFGVVDLLFKNDKMRIISDNNVYMDKYTFESVNEINKLENISFCNELLVMDDLDVF